MSRNLGETSSPTQARAGSMRHRPTGRGPTVSSLPGTPTQARSPRGRPQFSKAESGGGGKDARPSAMEFEAWSIHPDRLTKEPRLYLERLPALKAVALAQIQPLLLAKLKQSTVVLDFTKPSTKTCREVKTENMYDVATSFSDIVESRINEATVPAYVEMFRANCIRTLPPPTTTTGLEYDPDEDVPVMEPAWAHLDLAYTLFIKMLKSRAFSVKHAHHFLSRTLMRQIVEMLDCEDPRERVRVEAVLHVIYLKAVHARAYLRTCIYNVCYRFMYETHRFNGMANLLRFLQKVINGFTTPVRREHIHTFNRILLPMLKARRLHSIYQQLLLCIISFVDKQPDLADTAVKYVLQHWPASPSMKQLIFLEILNLLLLKMSRPIFKANLVGIMKRLAACIESHHFQVAERAMLCFKDRPLLQFVADYSRRCAAILLPVLLKVLQEHWCQQVKFIAIEMTSILQEVDAMAVQKCAHEIEMKQEQAKETRQRRAKQWKALHELACTRADAAGLSPPAPPSPRSSRTNAVEPDVDLSQLSLESLSGSPAPCDGVPSGNPAIPSAPKQATSPLGVEVYPAPQTAVPTLKTPRF